MKWDYVAEYWIARLLADDPLRSVMGYDAFVYDSDAPRKERVPSIEYTILGDRETENFNPILVQVDLFLRGAKKAAQAERRVRTLTHNDAWQQLGSEWLSMRYLDRRSINYPEPGVKHTALDFLWEPVKGEVAA